MRSRASARNVAELIMEHISESYAEYLEPESTVQIYGTLSDELAQKIDGSSQGRTTKPPPSVSRSGCPQCVLLDANHRGSDGTDTQHCLRPPDRRRLGWLAVRRAENHPRWDPHIELNADGSLGLGSVARRRNSRFGETPTGR